MSTKAEDIARKAAELVGGDRARQHGDKRANHDKIATLWNGWLAIRRAGAGAPLTARDVVAMMVLLKLARMETGMHNIDDAQDAVGYASILGELDDADAEMVATTKETIVAPAGMAFTGTRWAKPDEFIQTVASSEGDGALMKETPNLLKDLTAKVWAPR